MFEINDERLGKLKIFNVTEARANFADVLREPDAKVVVTRHGRPTKILLNYDEFLALISSSASTSVHHSILEDVGAEGVSAPEDKGKALPPKWVPRDAEQLVSSLKGLFNK